MTKDMHGIPVRVVVCPRPLSTVERAQHNRVPMKMEKSSIDTGTRTYHFDEVLLPTASQQDVCDATIEHLFDPFFDGYNVTVLAYGQTGSGKSHTMSTDLIPQAIQRVLEISSKSKNENNTNVVLKVSFLEIYSEDISDLLGTSRKLQLRDVQNFGITVSGLSHHTISSLKDVQTLLECGGRQRATAATDMNEASSRSHAILTLTMYQDSTDDGAQNAKVSKFHFVDLAGSERCKKTRSNGDRFKEGRDDKIHPPCLDVLCRS